MDAVLLDSGPLGRLAHSRPRRESEEWLEALFNADIVVGVSEVIDYEVRRELVRSRSVRGIERLEFLRARSFVVPLDTDIMHLAAELWAEARNQGQPTAPDHSLDVDVILAAQAQWLMNFGHDVVVATMNSRHLSRFVPAQFWLDIKP